MCENVNNYNDAVSLATEQSHQLSALEARINLLRDELDLLEQKKGSSCNMDFVRSKVVNAEENVKNIVDGSRRGTFDSHASLGHSVDQFL